MERLYLDTRHLNVDVFHHGPLAERRFNQFSLTFADEDEVTVLEQLEQLGGQAGVERFMALVASLNLRA